MCSRMREGELLMGKGGYGPLKRVNPLRMCFEVLGKNRADVYVGIVARALYALEREEDTDMVGYCSGRTRRKG